MVTVDDILRALEQLHERIRSDDRLQQDFEESRGGFFAHPAQALAPGSELRHLEWYLLERPSPVLGAVPAAALTAEGGMAELPRGALLGSLPGAFEVTAAGEEGTTWVRDLFTQGEHPLERGPADLQVGDLIAGRIYPWAAGSFVASPAAITLRSPEVLAAVRSDLAAMRAARRGVLRVQQLELERLFHGHAPVVRPASDPIADLAALGIAPAQASQILSRLREGAKAGSGSLVTELMNRLAFETDVDLEKARQVLVQAWHDAQSATSARERTDAREALANFDRGRLEGRDLEILFSELERDLGLDGDEAPEDEDSAAPAFPGVVAAMIAEFLWDVEREHGAERARAYQAVNVLGDYAKDVGVFEELDRTRLLDFSARWLLDETRLDRPGVAAVLESLQAFCTWAEDTQGVPLRRDFEATLLTVRKSVERLSEARPFFRAGKVGGLATVTEVDGERLVVKRRSGEGAELAVDRGLARCIRPGDVLRLAKEPGGILAAYPPEIGPLASPSR